MRFSRVADWLQWQQQLHPRAIDPGLDRVSAVGEALGVLAPSATVISVAGTNGKGSTVAFLESLATELGYRPGCYTSPHIRVYNERIRVAGEPVSDEMLLAAFDAVDRARGDTTLSFFEFGTLAALWCFARSGADPWLLEVGLGGRLDAVNAISADVSVVTSIALDHADWLGNDLDAIGREKAGIMRRGRPAICGMATPPAGLLAAASEHGARTIRRGIDFDGHDHGASWDWRGVREVLPGLPRPAWTGGVVDNAATALAAWEAACSLRFPDAAQAQRAVAATWLPGRLQWLDTNWLLDVAHNPAAAQRLADGLSRLTLVYPVRAVIAVMARKELAGIVRALADVVTVWHPLILDDDDAWDPDDVAEAVRAAGGEVGAAATPASLFDDLDEEPGTKLVCGAFRAVEEAMRWYGEQPVAHDAGTERGACSKG
jgi:dihydrofolate synthase/folylpolyglutamate synthase